MPEDKSNIELLIMAAGASRRLGQPKQLVNYKGNSLIRRITQEAIKADIGNVTVVLGANHDAVKSEIEDLDAEIFLNKEWEEGLGASIRNGLSHVLKKNNSTQAILLMMVDQPFVEAKHLQKLAKAYDPARPMIVASAYSSTFGVPVLFDKTYFEEMLQLKGDEGGKKVFVKYLRQIVEIPFIEGSIDIDEKEDLKSIQ